MTPAEHIRALLDGHNPSDSPPTEAPWSELSRILQSADASDRADVLSQWVANADGHGESVIAALVELQNEDFLHDGNQALDIGRLWTVRDLISENFEELPILVGERNNGFMVRGEGHLIVGPPGVGKTLLCFDIALRLACGMSIFGFDTPQPLSVLIFQAELPLPFVQYRFNRIIEGYRSYGNSNIRGANIREGLQRVHLQELANLIDLKQPQIRNLIARICNEIDADVVIFDPFLPFFGGDENSNQDVRHVLDSVKFEIAQQCDCAIIITDHIAKSDPGEGPRARGAGAKVDWSSLVINLSPYNIREEERGQLIAADVTKMRYGWIPSSPFILRRHSRSLRHSIWAPEHNSSVEPIRQLILEGGGQVDSQGRMLELICNHFNVGERVARRILASAVEQGIETDTGPYNSIIYRLPGGYDCDSEYNGDDDSDEVIDDLW